MQYPHSRRSRHRLQPQPIVIVDTISAFGRVVHSCFGKILLHNWRSTIAEFRRCCLLIDVPKFPLKIHAVCSHVEPRCLKTGCGLGVSTEQSLESAHRDFATIWSNSYSITDTNHPRYASQLLRCVIDYNSRHLPHASIRQHEDDGRGSTLMSTGSPQIHEGPDKVPGITDL